MLDKLVVGNWKMNGSAAFVESLLVKLRAQRFSAEVVVCAPFVYLHQAAAVLADTRIQIGAQNVCEYESGAYTGEISAQMLADIGCSYVVIGHSERRQYYGETNEVIARKVQQSLKADLTPILCVGETLADREGGLTDAVIGEQLSSVLEALTPTEIKRLVVAYEPIWAIGTGRTATVEQAYAAHTCLRKHLVHRIGDEAILNRILYGGSVKADNAQALFQAPNIDGGLVGGASLNPVEFAAIANAA